MPILKHFWLRSESFWRNDSIIYFASFLLLRNCVIIAAQIGTIAKKAVHHGKQESWPVLSFGKKSRFLVRENILPGRGDINK